MKLLQLLAFAALLATCTKVTDPGYDANFGGVPYYHWYRAIDFAFDNGALADSSGDMIILSYEDFSHLMDDSTAFRRAYVTPFATKAAKVIYEGYDFATSFQADVFTAFHVWVNRWFTVKVWAYCPQNGRYGTYYEMQPVYFYYYAPELVK